MAGAAVGRKREKRHAWRDAQDGGSAHGRGDGNVGQGVRVRIGIHCAISINHRTRAAHRRRAGHDEKTRWCGNAVSQSDGHQGGFDHAFGWAGDTRDQRLGVAQRNECAAEVQRFADQLLSQVRPSSTDAARPRLRPIGRRPPVLDQRWSGRSTPNPPLPQWAGSQPGPRSGWAGPRLHRPVAAPPPKRGRRHPPATPHAVHGLE